MRITGKRISITMQFESDGLVIRVTSDGAAASESFRKQTPNVLLLKLPRSSGKDLCHAFKSHAASNPFVVLSANAEVEDKVLLLDLGADDDSVKKPFNAKELLARVRLAMRRVGPPPQHVTNVTPETITHELLTFGDVRIDFTSMEGTRAGQPLSLTSQQFKLLKFFARSSGRVVSRDELLNEVWGYENYPTTRTVDNQILRLRQKLEPDPANPRYLLTVYGAGYKFTTGKIGTSGQTSTPPIKRREMGDLIKESGLSRREPIETRRCVTSVQRQTNVCSPPRSESLHQEGLR